jgi:predicted nucleic acid-binding protein
MGEPVETPIGTVTVGHFRPGGVRHQVFAGPKFLYALFNPEDRMHVVSRAFMDFLRDGDLPYRRIVLDEHVVDETATRLKKRASLRYAVAFLETLDESTLYRVEQTSQEVFEDATDTFVEWTDLNASFTDFVVARQMNSIGIDHILSYDSHFDAFDVTTLPYRE